MLHGKHARIRVGSALVGVLLLGSWLGAQASTAPASPATKGAVLERVVVIGASVSAGFDLASFSNKVSLAAVLDQMIKADHGKVKNISSGMFFGAPKKTGASLVAKALDAKPTLVVALDFLFWYGYGKKKRPEQRLEDLDDGLELLQKFDCPVLITRFPDMSASIGKMLSKTQVPAPDELEALNNRLEAWAKQREQVIVVPMVKFLDQARAGKALEVGQVTWPAGSKRLLLQPDELHPTMAGSCALAYLALHELDQRCPDVKAASYSHDPHALAKKLGVVKAARAARDAGEKSSEEDKAYYRLSNEAVLLAKKGKYREAIERLTEFVKAYPDSPYVKVMRRKISRYKKKIGM